MQSRCRCALKKAFLYWLALHEPKKRLYRESKKFLLAESFTNLTQSRFLRTKTSFTRAFLRCPQKPHFLRTKSLSFGQTFSYCYPKQLFSTLRHPFQRPLTYCLKRMQLFFCCLLNSLRCKAGASHRFKSLPAIPGEVAAFLKTGYLMMAAYFSENHVSTGDLNRPRSPEVRKPLVYFWFFSYTRKE